MIKKVVFVSEEEACGMTGRFNAGVISITNAFRPPADLKKDTWGAILRLKFDDVDKDMTSQEARYYQFFEGEDAGKILKWLQDNEYNLETVVVHCAAGISRSAAVAKFIAELYKIKNFNHNYTLYNKHVYRVLRDLYYGKDYE